MSSENVSEAGTTSSVLRVEDLISMAMGLPEKNTVNFKLLQKILLILARQMRLLGQEVELNLDRDDLDRGRDPQHGEAQGKTIGKKSSGLSVTEREDPGKGKILVVETRSRVQDVEKGSKKRDEEKGSKTQDAEKGSKKPDEERGTKIQDAKKESKKQASERGSKKQASEKGSKKQDAEKGSKEQDVEKRYKEQDAEKRSKQQNAVPEQPTRHSAVPRVGSIEVVTQQEFQELQAMVEELERMAGPIPLPSMPNNKTLTQNILQGTSSLTDTMQAMQLAARVKAAEEAVTKMSQLLTELVGSVDLPEGLVDMADQLMAEVDGLKADVASTQDKSVSAGVSGRRKDADVAVVKMTPGPEPQKIETSIYVTQAQMKDHLRNLQNDLMKRVNAQSAAVERAADAISYKAKDVEDKVEVISDISSRVHDLQALITDYNEQINGLAVGFTAQMQGFQEQVGNMNEELELGMSHLRSMSSSESSAVKELRLRHDGLVKRLTDIQSEHDRLTHCQKSLADELQSLVDCAELMRENKADREEVLDGLRDKADLTLLTGLLLEKDFQNMQDELEMKIEICNEKFRRQEETWLEAISDLYAALEPKADLEDLHNLREHVQQQREMLQQGFDRLVKQLSIPKAAILRRKLSLDGTCGVCQSPALLEMETHGVPKPEEPPKAGLGPPAEQELEGLVCTRAAHQNDTKLHFCNRYVGGSHTLVPAKRERCPPGPALRPAKRFLGKGSDGKMYRLEDELVPCEECNKMADDHVGDTIPPGAPEPPGNGRGDGDMKELTDRRVTIFEEQSRVLVNDIPELHLEDKDARRRSSGEGPRPSIIGELRRSILAGPGIGSVMGFVTEQLSGVGDIVRGRVTVKDEDAALRAAVLHEIREERASEDRGEDIEGEKGDRKEETVEETKEEIEVKEAE